MNIRESINTHKTLSAIVAAILIVTALFSVEHFSGLSASVEHAPIYGSLKMPSETLHGSAPQKKMTTAQKRLALRRQKALSAKRVKVNMTHPSVTR